MYELLLKLCEQKHISITSLCKEVTGSQGNLSTWKKGYMRSDYLLACADKLGCSTDYLLGRTDSQMVISSWDELYSSLDAMSESQLDSLVRKIRDLLSERQGRG